MLVMGINEIKEILQPLTQRLGNLESQERINSDAYSVDALGNWTFPGDVTVLGNIIGVFSIDANDLVGTTLAANVVTSSLTSVGTLVSLTVTGLATLNGAAAVAGDVTITAATKSMVLGVAASANALLTGSLAGDAVIRWAANTDLLFGIDGADYFGKWIGDSSGSQSRAFVIAENPLGFDDHNILDFWFDTPNRKLKLRAIVLAEVANRVQIYGTQFNRSGASDYVKANTNIPAGEKLMSVGGFGGINYGGSVPDSYSFSMITFITDPQGTSIATNNRPGAILFETNRQGVDPGQGDAMANIENTAMLNSGNWLMGLAGGSWTTSISAQLTALSAARLNLHSATIGNTPFQYQNMIHGDTPSAGETSQALYSSWFVSGTTGGSPGYIETAKLEVTKLADFLGAANQSSQFRISIITAGTLEARLTMSPSQVEVHAELLTVPASSDRASIIIPSGSAPSAPTDGDFWYDGTNLKFRNGATTRTITWV